MDIRLLVQLDNAGADLESDIELVSICHLVESNLVAWRLANDMAASIRTVAQSPELDAENKIIEQLNRFSGRQHDNAHRYLEVTRDLIAATAFNF